MLYSGKWSVQIFNNLTLVNGNITFLGHNTDFPAGPYIGSKVGAIAVFSQALTAGEITSLSTWGIKSFIAL